MCAVDIIAVAFHGGIFECNIYENKTYYDQNDAKTPEPRDSHSLSDCANSES